MPTNEDRREIANELRYTASHSLNEYSFQRSVEGTVFGTIGDRSWRETLTRLADIIEPEPERTCRVDRRVPSNPFCSKCGKDWDDDWCYGPRCGAKVVEE